MPIKVRPKGEKKKKLPKAPPSRPRHANPKHPMNAERTGPLRKKSGGATKKKVPTPKPLRKAMKEKFEENVRDANFVAPKSGKGTLNDPAKNSVTLKRRAFNKTLKENPKAVKRLNKMAKKSKTMKSGGKLKMVEKDGKKVPFFAADGIGKMNKGGPVEVRKGMTLSQIAKDNNTSIQALLAANPSIKNANAIRIGQKIKMPKAGSVPGNTKTKNPYARMSQTQMNMMRSKDKGQQRAVTSAMRNEVKNTGAQTSPTPKKAKAVKDSRSAVSEAKKKELIAKMKADKAKKPKKKSLLSRLFGGNKKKPAVPSNDIAAKNGGVMKRRKPKMAGQRMTATQKKAEYLRRLKKQKPAMTAGKMGNQRYKSGGMVRGAGAATKGKRFGRAG
jgi:LysM repeat protein